MWMLLVGGLAQAGWFDGELDYWEAGHRPRPTAAEGADEDVEQDEAGPPQGDLAPAASAPAGPFDWSPYVDPERDEFWAEAGGFTPPPPLREVLTRCAKDEQSTGCRFAVANYRRWQQTKIALAARGQQVLYGPYANGLNTSGKQKEAYHEATGFRQPEPAPEAVHADPEPTPTPAFAMAGSERRPTQQGAHVPWRQVQIAYFYRATCPACRASTPLVKELERQGAQVVKIHMAGTDGSKAALAAYPDSVPYTRALAAQLPRGFDPTRTPTWVIRVGDRVGTLVGAVDGLEPMQAAVADVAVNGARR